jgi:hypothetical protein
MSNQILAKVFQIWWAGVRVFFRWFAFCIVLVALWFPAMAIANLVGNYAGYVLGIVFSILMVPLLFYLTSKYLLLLGDNDGNPQQGRQRPTDAGKRMASPEAAS